MSIHSFVNSNITSFRDLTAMLNASGIPWRTFSGYSKVTGRAAAHAVEAEIAGETVWIFQFHPGEPFRFQSRGWWFGNRAAVESFVSSETPERMRQRQLARQQELERLQREQEQRRIELERQRAVEQQRRREEEQRWREEERRRRAEAERQRQIEEERRRVEEEERRRAEEQRQRALAAEAAGLLQQLDEQRAQAARQRASRKSPFPEAQTTRPRVAPAPPSARAVDESMPADLDSAVGKLLQQAAQQKIMEHIDELEETYGLYLHSRQDLEDETVELTLRDF
jgi:hypothetical protein